jgi:ABC-type transport system substrate-binding protein
MRHVLMAVLLWAGLTAPGLAETRNETDSLEFRRIISSQLNAFKAGDGHTAYNLTAPNIKALFPSPETFMRVMRQGYPQVYRPKSYRFLRSVAGAHDNAMQQVQFVGPDEQIYSAFYALEKQDDGSWRIAGCLIVMEAFVDA